MEMMRHPMGWHMEKPSNKLETVKTIVEILAEITAIAKAVYEMLKG